MTSKRIDKVRQEISLKNLDGIYVNNITNVRYLTVFSGSAGSLLILENFIFAQFESIYNLKVALSILLSIIFYIVRFILHKNYVFN